MIKWFACGGGIAKYGPFDTQIDAVNAMRLADDPSRFPPDVFVWPEAAGSRSAPARTSRPRKRASAPRRAGT